MKRYLFFLASLLLCLNVFSQNFFVITSQVPNVLNVCNEQKTGQISIENPSSFLASSVTVTLTLPTGVTYVPSSITNGTEQNISNLNQPVFTLTNINSLTTRVLTYKIESNCNVIAYLSGGGVPSNGISVNYTANSNNITQTHTTSDYNVNVPNLSVSSFTNQVIPAGNIGASYQRCITITNGGVGHLTEFTLENTHGNGITIDNVSKGTRTTAGQVETVVLTSADFLTIGDGDAFFETGESIVICEDFTVNNCSNVLSNYNIFWGCSGQKCQNVTSSSNVVFSNVSPVLKFVSIKTDNSTCHGLNNVRKEGVKTTNIGNGLAIDAGIYVYQTYTGAVFNWPYMLSAIDTASIMVSINGGTPFHMSPDSVVIESYTGAQSCPNPKIGQFLLVFDTIKPGDTIDVNWDVVECSIDNGCGQGRLHADGWFVKADYKNICNSFFQLDPRIGRSYYYFRDEIASNLSPANIVSGQTKTFNYLLSSHEKSISRNNSADKFIYKIVLPPCLTYGGNLRILNADNTLITTATKTYVLGDTTFVELDNLGNTPIIQNGQLVFDLSADCGLCGNVSGTYPIEIYSTYNPDTTCVMNHTYQLGCFTSDIYVVCPQNCEGLNFTDFVMKRVNIGKADNDNDGLPDAINVPDMNLVRTDRVMFSDTIVTKYKAYINKLGTSPTFNYVSFKSTFDYGNRFTFLTDTIDLYDASTGIKHTAVLGAPAQNTLTGTTRNLLYEVNINTAPFIPALPGGFLLDNNDSVELRAYFRASSNIGNTNQFTCKMENNGYVSTNASPPAIDQFGCNDLEGYVTLIGYYHTASGQQIYSHTNCDTTTITRVFYYSVGPCCSNYAGGNLFPFEYRVWAVDDSVVITTPGEYELIDYKYYMISTGGSGVGRTSKTYTVPPNDGYINNKFVFDFNYLYNDSMVASDDGYYTYHVMRLAPTCNTPKGKNNPLNYKVYKQESYTSSQYLYNISDSLRYDGPVLNIQSSLPSINVYDSTVVWDLTVSNLSNISSANNTWISTPTISGITVNEIYDVTNSVVLTPDANGFYPLGTFANASQTNYQVRASFNSCDRDSLQFNVGWGCQGYPTSLATYPCTPERIMLYAIPQIPNLEVSIPSLTDTLKLCDTGSIEISIKNVQTGYGYATVLNGLIPPGAFILNGTSEFMAPDTNGYINVPDPTNTNANNFQWSFGDEILKGIQEGDNEGFIRFKFVTTCDYTSGSQFNFYAEANAACPYRNRSFTTSSEPTIIDDAILPYEATVKVVADFISPCKGSTNLQVIVINNGPQNITSNDSVIVRIPVGVNYVANSFVGIYNAPSNQTPNILDLGYKELSWKLPSGTTVGDSSVFSIEITGDKDSLDCSIVTLDIFSTSTVISNCVSTATACSINTITGDTSRNIFVFKSYVSLLNDQSTSSINSPGGEIGYVNFDVYNTGDTISDAFSSYISYYFDVDNNGILSSADSNFHTTTKNIFIYGDNGTTNVKDTISIPAAFTCGVIAVLDSTENACICSSTQIPLNFDLKPNLSDTFTCSNVPMVYDLIDSISGYSYSWTPATNLSNASIANPTFQKINTGLIPDTTIYYLEINRGGGCLAYDTIAFVVLPNVLSNAGIDDSLCGVNSYTLSANFPYVNYNQQGIWSQAATNPTQVTFNDNTSPIALASNFIEGTYALYWKVYTTCDSISDTLILEVYDAPIANAGMDDSICNVYSYTLNGNNPVGRSTGVWTADAGNTTTSTFVNNTAYNTVVNGLSEGTYTFYWTVSNGNCASVTDTVVIDVFDTPVSNAGMNDSICNAYSYTLNGNNPVGRSTGVWTADAGNTTPSTFVNNTLYNTVVNGLSEGTYTFYWTVSNGNCTPVVDTVVIDVFDTPVSNAGMNDSICNIYTYTLNGNNPVGRSTGVWTADAGNTTTSTFVNNTLYNTVVNGLSEGTYTFYWTVSNGNCTPVVDTVVIDVFDTPIANAGLNDSLCNIYTYTLNGNLPAGRSTGIWTQAATDINLSTFTDNTLYNTSVTNLVEGTYTYYWTVSNGNCLSVTDTVTIEVYDTPYANAGLDDSLCGVYTYTLNGNNPAGRSTGIWSADPSNTSVVSFVNNTKYNTVVNGLLEGTYILYWTVSNGNCLSVVDTVVLEVYNIPVSNAGLNDSLCGVYTYTLNGNNPAGRSTGVWTSDAGNTTASTLVNDTLYNTLVTGLSEGTYTYYWTVSNGNCTPVVDTVIVDVFDEPISNAGPNDTLCNQYAYTLAANTPQGRSSGAWVQDVNNTSIATFSDVNSPISSVSDLIEGTYTFYWVVVNGNCTPAIDTIILDVYDQPIATVGEDATICNQPMFALSANAALGRSTGVWTVSPNSPVASMFINANDPNTTVTGLIYGDYTFYWTISNDGCPFAQDSLRLLVRPNPVARIESSIQEICENECIDFDGSSSSVITVTGDQIISYSWLFGDGGSSDIVSDTYCYSDEGIYDVQLIVNTTSGCGDTIVNKNYILVNPLPTAYFTYTPEYPKIYEVMTFTDSSYENINSIQFSFSDGIEKNNQEFIKTFADTGYYSVKLLVETDKGCKDSLIKDIYIKNELAYFVPNTFSPNGDGVNDEFLPIFHNIEFEDYRFYVFDRWGEKIFETDLRNKAWDGFFKNERVKTGVYVWKINYREKNDADLKTFNGHVIVIE